MVRIITDSSCMMNKEQGRELNIQVVPLSVTINNVAYRDLEDMHSEQFLSLIKEKHMPVSSQPPIGEVVEVLESSDEPALFITMADGLSGTYGSVQSAREMCKAKDKITVFNSRTLCGPQKHLAIVAAELAKKNQSVLEIVSVMEEKLAECRSFLLPSDFDFLRRGGRMTPLAATMGGWLKLKPIIVQTKDGKRLDKLHVARTFKAAVDAVLEEMKKAKLDITHKIYVSHADAAVMCEAVLSSLKSVFPQVDMEVIALSPAMITQGGPGCIAIQYIKK